jgi:hypothetical protein
MGALLCLVVLASGGGDVIEFAGNQINPAQMLGPCARDGFRKTPTCQEPSREGIYW